MITLKITMVTNQLSIIIHIDDDSLIYSLMYEIKIEHVHVYVYFSKDK